MTQLTLDLKVNRKTQTKKNLVSAISKLMPVADKVKPAELRRFLHQLQSVQDVP